MPAVAAVIDRRCPAQRVGKTQPRAEAAEADALGSNRRPPSALKGRYSPQQNLRAIQPFKNFRTPRV